MAIALLIFLFLVQWTLRAFWYPPEPRSPYWRKLALCNAQDSTEKKIVDAYLYDSTWGVQANNLVVLEINKADSAMLEGLPQIGGFLAQRIIQYREALGGYYSLIQLLEIPQLKESTWESLHSKWKCNGQVKKLHVNQATLDELVQHPYLSYPQAQRLIRYRQSHGPYRQIEDIKLSKAIPDSMWSKILYYLAVDSTTYETQ
jgi:DNA uptake protein ComE-like DNA-binding protein